MILNNQAKLELPEARDNHITVWMFGFEIQTVCLQIVSFCLHPRLVCCTNERAVEWGRCKVKSGIQLSLEVILKEEYIYNIQENRIISKGHLYLII